jgi:hypothetical protein
VVSPILAMNHRRRRHAAQQGRHRTTWIEPRVNQQLPVEHWPFLISHRDGEERRPCTARHEQPIRRRTEFRGVLCKPAQHPELLDARVMPW